MPPVLALTLVTVLAPLFAVQIFAPSKQTASGPEPTATLVTVLGPHFNRAICNGFGSPVTELAATVTPVNPAPLP